MRKRTNMIFLNDVGIQFLATISEDGEPVDLSGTTTRMFRLRKPDGNSLEKNVLLYGDGTDGKVYWVSASGDLDKAGIWQIQFYMEEGNSRFHSTIGTFRVHRSL